MPKPKAAKKKASAPKAVMKKAAMKKAARAGGEKRIAKKLVAKPGKPVSSPANFMRKLLEQKKRMRQKAEQNQQGSNRDPQRFDHVKHISFSKFAGPRRKAA